MNISEEQFRIINIIREIRNDNKLSQAGLAHILKISSGAIGNIESTKYKQKYTLKEIYNVCQEFKIPIEKIFLTEEELKVGNTKIIELLIKKIISYEE